MSQKNKLLVFAPTESVVLYYGIDEKQVETQRIHSSRREHLTVGCTLATKQFERIWIYKRKRVFARTPQRTVLCIAYQGLTKELSSTVKDAIHY